MTRVNVMGVGISAVDAPRALRLVREASLTAGFTGYVTATGVHGVIASQDDPALKRVHNQAFLTLPDGAPMVWVGWARGQRDMGLVYGPDFMRLVLAHTRDQRHFLWGGADKVAPRLRETLGSTQVVGCATPPFRPLTESEELALVDALLSARPHFVWVGLSTPKQEWFMAGFLRKYADRLRFEDHGLVLLGVGAAFDFLSGTVPEPPRWLRGTGLQWVHRMLMEPRRLGPRYLRNNPRFVWGMLNQWLQPERFPLE